jgi:hypothetical protein
VYDGNGVGWNSMRLAAQSKCTFALETPYSAQGLPVNARSIADSGCRG